MLDGHVDVRDVERGFAALERASRNIRPLLSEARKPLRTDIREHQRERRGPDGPWPGLSPETLRKRGRTKSGRRRRKRTLGKLARLIAIRIVGGDTLMARAKVAWAWVQQHGGRAGRGATIPAREFLYFSQGFVDDIHEALRVYLERGWGRR